MRSETFTAFFAGKVSLLFMITAPERMYASMKIFALVMFILMYVCMIALPKFRPYIALTVAAVFLISGVLPITELLGAVNLNVIMMIVGTMLLVDYFIESKMPNLLADKLLDVSKNVMWVTILLSLFSGFISAFIDNVATVLMVAPVGLAICKKLNINPIGMILSIAVSSNLQGAATLVGDTTSIMLGDAAGMNFLDFFWMQGRPGIFFAVELGAIMTVPIMMILFRRDKHPVNADVHTKVNDKMPTVMLLLMVCALIVASFIPDTPDMINGIICCSFALLTVILDLVKNKKISSPLRAFKNLDYETVLLLFGLFVVIGGITNVGLVNDLASGIIKLGNGNAFLMYTVIVWGSVLVSAFVDNIPYVATMLPVLTIVANTSGIPSLLLFFGLLTGATLGGNLTPIGASANITAVGMLKKEGYIVRFRDFMRIGAPFTLTAVLTGYLFIWIFWS